MKKLQIQRLRTVLQALVIVFATLAVQHLWLDLESKQGPQKIITLCELPAAPKSADHHFSHYEEIKESGHIFVAFSLSAPMEELDAWLDQVDAWKEHPPAKVLSFSIRESQSESRIDFSAEIQTKEPELKIAESD